MEYNYPKHLSIKELSNTEDKKIFTKMKKAIVRDIELKLKEDLFAPDFKNEINVKGLFEYYKQLVFS